MKFIDKVLYVGLLICISAKALSNLELKVQTIELKAQNLELKYNQAFSQIQSSEIDSLLSEIEEIAEGTEQDSGVLRRLHDIKRHILVLAGCFYHDHGRDEDKEEIFRKIIKEQFDDVFENTVASKAHMQSFERFKLSNMVEMAIKSVPENANVYIDNEYVGNTPLFNVLVFNKGYHLKVSCPGYKSHESFIEPMKLESNILDIVLEKNTGNISLAINPGSVDIYCDGRYILTSPPVSGKRFELTDVSLGNHVFEFKKKCYESHKVFFNVTLGDSSLGSIYLNTGKGDIKVTSQKPVQIFLNGELVGSAPLDMKDVCTDSYLMEARSKDGFYWYQNFTLHNEESRHFEIFPRPKVLYLGFFTKKSNEENFSLAEQIEQKLNSCEGLNLVLETKGKTSKQKQKELFSQAADFVEMPYKSLPLVKIKRIVDQICEAEKIDVAGLTIKSEKETGYALLLFYRELETVEMFDFYVKENHVYFPRFTHDALNRKVCVTQKFLGFDYAEIDGSIVVTRIVEGSNAESSGIAVGDKIVSLNSKPVHTVDEYENILEAALGRVHKLVIASEGSTKEILLPDTKNILSYELDHPGISYVFLLDVLNKRLEETDVNAVLLNKGVALMALNQSLSALQTAFLPCSLAEGEGVSWRTVLFLRALAGSKLGHGMSVSQDFESSGNPQSKSRLLGRWGPETKVLVPYYLRQLK